MRTYTEAMTEEYNWITSTKNKMFDEAYASGKALETELRDLYNLASLFHGELYRNGKFADNFFHIMEELKGVLGDYGRAIRGEQLPAHIQEIAREEREGFGFRY